MSVRPFVYLSYPITGQGIEDECKEPEWAKGITRTLNDNGCDAFSPLMHNPWNSPDPDNIPKSVLWHSRDTTASGMSPGRRAYHHHFISTAASVENMRQGLLKGFMRKNLGAQSVVMFDVSMIARSVLVMADLSVPSVGVSQELVYAGFCTTPVVGLIQGADQKVSKWAVAHCNYIFTFDSIEQAIPGLIESLCL